MQKDISGEDISISNDSQEYEEPIQLGCVAVSVGRASTNRSYRASTTRGSSSAELEMPNDAPATYPIKAATTNAFDRIFHAYDENFLPSRMYSRIIPEKNRRKSSVKIEDIRWMIHPHSQFKFFWDILVVIVLLFTVVVLPVGLAFYSEDQLKPEWVVINVLVDSIFLADVVVVFRTVRVSKTTEDKVISDPKKVAKAYLTGWFAIDFISAFPFDYIIYAATMDRNDIGIAFSRASFVVKFVRLTRLLGLLKLLRVSKLLRFFDGLEGSFDIAAGILNVVKLVVLMVLLTHWNGCIQFLIPYLQNVPEDSWIAINNIQNASVGEQYSWAMFKALSHMLSIGFGRFPPQNVTEVWLTILSMIVGATFYALFIGNISTILLSSDSSGRLYDEKLSQVEQYMRYRKIPQALRKRVQEYYEYRYRRKFFNEQGILDDLSKGLKESIISFNYRQLIQNTPLFHHSNEKFVTAVLTKLNVEVFLKDEVIIQSGSKGDRMYFIARGQVEIIDDEDKFLNTLDAGSYFGEICLLTEDRRTATVIAITPCDLCTLKRMDFEELVEEFPEVRDAIQSVAIKRLSRRLGVNQSSIELTKEGKLLTSVKSPSKHSRDYSK